jgi:catechol 2,3-dioxygenase-like lactoylglutathione lyase family enzyme
MIGRLNHVAIVVPDLAAAANTYRETYSAHRFPQPRTCLNTA